MSEIKRVALNTLEPQKVSEKVIKKLCKTIRISVILPESNEDYCPEYNYKDQLASVKKKVKQNKGPNTNDLENGLDPFGDNDDDVRRIALQMEAKYGSGMAPPGIPKKKRKGKKDDYADIGMGYDETDSFIDNTDGYDEIIPQNVTTLHGGFYVNSGALVFKTDDEASSQASSSSSSSSDSSSSESEGEDKAKSKNRKRVLDTSDSDSDTANDHKEKKPKLQSQMPANSLQQAIKKKLFSKNKIQVKKFQSIEQHKKTVKDLLRAKREDLDMSVPEELKTVDDNIEKESSKENKKPMSISSVTDAIESVVKQVIVDASFDKNQSQNGLSADLSTSSVINVSKKVDSQESLSTDSDFKSDLRKPGKEEETKLPDNLPSDIATIVSKLKEAGINYKGEGKKAFFTNNVNALLLSLEKKSKSVLSKSSRVKVYEHLTKYVNCTKDTLIRRAKLLELEEGEKKLAQLKVRLKDTIDAIMPQLVANYEQESQKILQRKFSKESVDNEELKSLKLPKRKFQWSEEAKKLVKDILGVKKRCLAIEGKHKDNLEEQITQFLRSFVLPLWPEGWMYMNNLTKVYNSMAENSKTSTASKANIGGASIKPQKHSNLSITPITNGKNSGTEKIEITNSITVTKVNSDAATKEPEKNHVVENSIRIPKSEVEQPSDLSAHSKKSDKYARPELLSFDTDLFTHLKTSDKYTKPDGISVNKPSDLSVLLKKNEKQPKIEVLSLDKSSGYIKPDGLSFDKPSDLSTQLKKTDKNEKFDILSLDKLSDLSAQLKKNDKQGKFEILSMDKPSDLLAQIKTNEKYVKTDGLSSDKYVKSDVLSFDKPSDLSAHLKKSEKHAKLNVLSLDKPSDLSAHLKKTEKHAKFDVLPLDKQSDVSTHLKKTEKHAKLDVLSLDKQSDLSEHLKKSDKHSKLDVLSMEKTSDLSTHLKKGDKHAKLDVLSLDKPSDLSAQLKKSDKHSKLDVLSMEKLADLSAHLKKNEKHANLEVLSLDKPSDLSAHLNKSDRHSKFEVLSMDKPSDLSTHLKKSDKYTKSNISSFDKPSDLSAHSKKVDKHAKPEVASLEISDLSAHSKKSDKHTKLEVITLDKSSDLLSRLKQKPEVLSAEKPTELSGHAKKNDMFKPYIQEPSMQKQNTENTTKHNEMFKPYADGVEKNVPDKSKYSFNSHAHSYSNKERHGSHSHSDRDRHGRGYSEKRKHESQNSEDSLKKPSSTELSRFQMFKPYSESRYERGAAEQRPPSKTYSKDLVGSKSAEEGGVIVKNEKSAKKEDAKDEIMASVSRGANSSDKRKVIDAYNKRNSTDINPIDFYPVVSKHSVFTSSPLVTKSDGDGQKDIQMVMENLKALQKLSCSPVKNSDSSSSPVSVIAYNKNFSSPKTTSSSAHCSRNDANSRNELSGGFQDEFQKQFINSLQQMAAANTNTSSKSGYKNGS